ncbi:MAG: PilZ domain-containing protein, partial [Dehalococcoidia bacterium]
RPEPDPQEDRRAYRRLDIHLPVTFHRVGKAISNINRTTTINVSTGGAYFETNRSDIEIEDHLALSFEVDPHDLRFPPNCTITTVAQVVRLEPLENQSVLNDMPLTRYGLAVKFRQPLKLSL